MKKTSLLLVIVGSAACGGLAVHLAGHSVVAAKASPTVARLAKSYSPPAPDTIAPTPMPYPAPDNQPIELSLKPRFLSPKASLFPEDLHRMAERATAPLPRDVQPPINFQTEPYSPPGYVWPKPLSPPGNTFPDEGKDLSITPRLYPLNYEP